VAELKADPDINVLDLKGQNIGVLGFNVEHKPLDDVRASHGSTRYWNSGCWIYEPDLSSRQAYARYCRYAWPGTAIVIDDAEPQPRLLELLADLNPLSGGPGLPKAPA